MINRANFTNTADGLVSEEITLEEYLSALSGPELANAKLVPLDVTDAEPRPVTLTDRTQHLDRRDLFDWTIAR